MLSDTYNLLMVLEVQSFKGWDELIVIAYLPFPLVALGLVGPLAFCFPRPIAENALFLPRVLGAPRFISTSPS